MRVAATEILNVYINFEYDAESGLYHLRARPYNPETGTFISSDPIGFAGRDFNLYRYVLNNPINFVDPDGRNPLAIAGALIGAGINIYQGIQVGGTVQQVIISGFVGAITGAAVGFGGFGLAALAGFANNSSNQIIFTGSIDFGEAAISGGVTGLAAGVGQLTTRTLNKIFFPVISESTGFATGALLGLGADTGISGSTPVTANACTLLQ